MLLGTVKDTATSRGVPYRSCSTVATENQQWQANHDGTSPRSAKCPTWPSNTNLIARSPDIHTMPLPEERLDLWLEGLIQQHTCTGDIQTTCVDARAPGRNRNRNRSRAMRDSSIAPPATGRRRRPLRSLNPDEDVPTDRLSQLHLSQSAPIPSLPPPSVFADAPSSSPD